MTYDLKETFEHFGHRGSFAEAGPFGNGHINDTYLVRTDEEDCPDYIMQRINHLIFTNPPGLMRNIELVTDHLSRSVPAGEDRSRTVLTLIPTHEGKSYFCDKRGNYWRLYLFIWPHRSYDIVPSPRAAEEGGRAFGRFQRLLTDLPGDKLSETIPRFHDIQMRLDAFDAVLEADRENRAALVKEEVAFVRERAEEMSILLKLKKTGELPLRVTHNDTKFNNVLLDEEDRQLCVIDLDTVMPGLVHYDFGDSIRTATNTAGEDERDLSKVSCDIEIFKGYTRGFLGETREILSDREKETLFLAGKTMTFIIGLRFLTDYLDGDKYFKIHREGHNLDRCRVQFKLVSSLEEQEKEIRKVIRELA